MQRQDEQPLDPNMIPADVTRLIARQGDSKFSNRLMWSCRTFHRHLHERYTRTMIEAMEFIKAGKQLKSADSALELLYNLNQYSLRILPNIESQTEKAKNIAYIAMGIYRIMRHLNLYLSQEASFKITVVDDSNPRHPRVFKKTLTRHNILPELNELNKITIGMDLDNLGLALNRLHSNNLSINLPHWRKQPTNFTQRVAMNAKRIEQQLQKQLKQIKADTNYKSNCCTIS